MTDDGRVDLGLSKFLNKEQPEEVVSDSLPEKDFKTSPFEISPELEKLIASKSWQSVSEICEKKISEDSQKAPLFRSLWVRSQIELGTTPATMLVAPLDSARKQIEGGKELNKDLLKITSKEIKSSYSKLAKELKRIGESDLFEHCLSFSGVKLEDKIVVEKEESKLIESSDNRKSAWLLPMFLLLLAGLLIAIGGYFFLNKLHKSRPVKTEIEDLKIPSTELPSATRAGVLEHLDPILYESDQKKTSMEKKSAQAKKPLKPTKPKKVGVIDTSGPIEPEEVHQKILQGEPIPGKSEDKASIVPLKPESKTKKFRVIARSKILVSPEYRAKVVGSLKPGQEVEVIEEGRIWLKLKAKTGRYGYMLAQDAILIK